MKSIKTSIILIILFAPNLFGQYANHEWGIAVNYSYTTTSKLYLFPNAIDPFLRDQHKTLDDIISYSTEVRYRVSNRMALGLNFEYLEGTSKNSIALGGPSGSILATADEGFSLVPVEFSVYYLLPFSTDVLKFHMGGGGGVYIGSHIRKIKDAQFENVSREMAYGIHVSTGMDYMIKDFLSVRGEMRFRDPQFEVESKYNKTDVLIADNLYALPQSTQDSKINVDGLTFTIGVVFHLF